jgi:hypothetical protein
MLQTEAFKEATKDLLLIYVDGDSPNSEDWNKKLKTRYYPSFVVLNQDLERVAVFSDINSGAHIKKLNEAISNLDDPLEKVEQRIAERKEGGFLRKIKDFFQSETNFVKDQKRYIEYLASVAKYDEVLDFLDKVEPNDEFEIIKKESHFLSSKENDVEFLKIFLSRSPEESPFYYYALTEFCGKTKKEEEFSEDCLKYKKIYLESIKINKDLPKEEQMLAKAINSKIRANLAEYFGEEEVSKKLFNQCVQNFEDLYAISPLNKKSRSVRIEQVSCLKEESQSVEILESLVKDYPFEETFHRKLAKHYAKKNNFKKALESNQNAIDYSYGYMWIYNVSERASYIRKASMNQEARELVESALAEVVLSKEDARVNNALKSLRAQYEALKVL